MTRSSLIVLAGLGLARVAHADPATTTTPDAAAPEAAPPPADDDATALGVRYDKGVTISSADETFLLRIGFRNQFRFESNRSTEDGAELESRVLIPRSRLSLEGNVFGKATRYKLELGLGDQGSFGFVRDLYVDRRVSEAPVWLRVGQWKMPFNRGELVSDFGSELNERALIAQFAQSGRELGVAAHNGYERSPEGVEWAIGVFNGFAGGADRPDLGTACEADPITGDIACVTPPPTTAPDDFAPAIAARVGWNAGDVKGYTEGDLEGGPLRWGVGLGYKLDLADFEGSEALAHGVTVDAMLKVAGFGFQTAVVGMRLAGGDFEVGAFAQPGYFVVPETLQVAARVGFHPVGDRTLLEVRGAFNWYWEGHSWKWMTDVGFVQLTGEDPVTMESDEPDLQLRSMLQLVL